MEPIHTIGGRTTADSKAEGRLKIEAGRIKKKKRNLLKKKLKKHNY